MNQQYDIAIVGGGASGTALLYVLSKYTNLKRIVLLEKYPEVGLVNSNAKNNSQTLHVGDIETNYNLEKVREVKKAAMMTKQYTDQLPEGERKNIIQSIQKMVLGVGKEEVEALTARFEELHELFPALQKLTGEEIAQVEPEVMRGRDPLQLVLALFNSDGYAVNYGKLAQSFVQKAQAMPEKIVDVLLGHEVIEIEKKDGLYVLSANNKKISAPIVVIDTDAYSLGFAKRMGYGKEFSLIPVAGSFYFSPKKLQGKVYRVQEKRMPFAAIHGDPELTKDDSTRFGPTARFYPVLEASKISTSRAFFASSGLHRLKTWISFFVILLEPIRFWYLVKNFVFDLPIVGIYFLLPELRKIIPTMQASEIKRAKGYGGMRLQRVDTNTHELLLGEGKIIGNKIIFNMSPSPGASVSLYNAMRDADQISMFDTNIKFNREEMLRDLCEFYEPTADVDTSLQTSYAS